nr:putative ACR, YhhQ family COG1738 [uncultured bacterium]
MLKIKRFDFLVSLYILCIAISELMGAKSFPIVTIAGLKLSASVALFVIPVIFSINDIITEVHGKERARSVVQSGLLMIVLLLIFSFVATILPPTPRFAKSESAYDTIFTFSIRISAASLIAFSIAEFLDVFIFSKIREKLGKSKLWLRNNLSNFISEFFDSTIFIFIAFYALNKPLGENLPFLIGLIVPYWLLKCFMSIIETPFVYLGVQWLKHDKKSN